MKHQWLWDPGYATRGEGLEYMLDMTPPWSASITLLLLIFAVIFVITIYVQERGNRFSLLGLPIPVSLVKASLAVARLALIVLVLVMLHELVWIPFRTNLPDMIVVLDVSESMDHDDHYEDRELQQELIRRIRASGLSKLSRVNLAKSLLLEKNAQRLRELDSKYKTKLYFIGDSARWQRGQTNDLVNTIQQLKAEDSASRLGNNLRTILEAQRGRPAAAMIVLTDGITTEGKSISEVASYAARKRVPLFLVGLGSDRPSRDVELRELLVDRDVFVNDLVQFEFKISGSGYEGEQTEVQLKRTGDELVLARQPVTIGPDNQPQIVRLRHQPTEAGKFEYEVEVVPLDGERSQTNNQQKQEIHVRNDKIRVLLVQAYPNYEFRFLKNVLARDKESIQLKTVLQDADLEYASTDATAQRVFPVRRDELFSYDVVVFGDVNPSFLSVSVMENLADFVTIKGGGIVFAAGPKFTPSAYRNTPLAALMPIDVNTATAPHPDELLVDSYTPRPTDLGMRTAQMQLGTDAADSLSIWRNLPGLYWLLEAPDVKPGVRVLAEHPTRTGNDGRPLPVICMHYVGAGKVIFHATDETWRWRYRVGDVFFARYWVQTIRYLSRSKLWGQDRAAKIESDREKYIRGESVRLFVRFFDDRLAPPQDDGVTVVLEQEGGRNRHITLNRVAENRGIFAGEVDNLPVGKYHLWIATPSFQGAAPSHDFEIDPPQGENARLEMDSDELKRAAAASHGKFYTIANIDQMLDDLPRGKQVQIESLDRATIWNSWMLAVAFLVLIIGEWVLRKRAGML